MPSFPQEFRRHARHSRPDHPAGPAACLGRRRCHHVAGAYRCRSLAQRGPDRIADIAEQVIEAVVNISTSQNVAGRGGAQQAQPQLPNDPQLDELFRDFFNRRGPQGGEQTARAHAAPGQLAGLRLHHRRDRHRGHQQSRDRRRRRDHRHPQRRHPHQGRADRPRSEDRHRAPADQDRQAAEGGALRRFRQAAARRMGDRHRQSVQPRRHR